MNFADDSAGLMTYNVCNEGNELKCGSLDGIMLHGEQ
jgi:hypothetical protein